MKLDLHCHTHFSDGTESLEWVVARAEENEVSHLAITDHDHLTAITGAASERVTLIPGVELSASWSNIEVHIVGLFVDHQSEALRSLVASQQAARFDRMQAMAEKLDKLGVEGLLEYLDALPAKAYTRTHVAKFLMASGAAKNHQKAFKNYLGKGAKAYVPGQWCEFEQAISAIHSAGGIAVLAHPGRYPINKRKLEELVRDFAHQQGDALEVRYPNIEPHMMKQLEALGVEQNLFFSGGSDFHDPGAHWTDIGKFPWLRGEAESRGVQHHKKWRG